METNQQLRHVQLERMAIVLDEAVLLMVAVVAMSFVLHTTLANQPLDDDSLMENQDENRKAFHIHPMVVLIDPETGSWNRVSDPFELFSILSKFFDFLFEFLLFSLLMVCSPKHIVLTHGKIN